MKKLTTATVTAEKFVPRPSALSRYFWSASSFVLTRKVPMMEQSTPMAAMISGMATAYARSICGIWLNASTPSAQVEVTEPT